MRTPIFYCIFLHFFAIRDFAKYRENSTNWNVPVWHIISQSFSFINHVVTSDFRFRAFFANLRNLQIDIVIKMYRGESTKWLKCTVWNIISQCFSFINHVVIWDFRLRLFFANQIDKVIQISRIREKWSRSKIWCHHMIYEGKTMWNDRSHPTF
jgi:hypothetical protein